MRLLIRFATLHLGLTLSMFVVALLALPLRAAEPLHLVTQEFPPFSYQQNGVISGLAPTLVQRICAEMQRECTMEIMPWRRAQEAVRLGRFDGMFLIGHTPERERWLHFSPPIVATEYGLFVRADDPLQFRQPADLAGYRVAVYGPSGTSHSLEALSREVAIEINLYPDAEPGFRQLPVGRVDAVYSNRMVGEALITRLRLSGIRYAGRHRRLNYFVGFSRASVPAATVTAFAQAWQRLKHRGELDVLFQQYGVETRRERYSAR